MESKIFGRFGMNLSFKFANAQTGLQHKWSEASR